MPDDLILGAMRGLHLAALSLSVGGLLLASLGAAPGLRMPRVFVGLALLTGLGWLGIQGGATGGFPAGQWLLLTETGFGRVMALRLALLALALWLGRQGLWPVLVAIALQPLLGHGAAMDWPVALSGAGHAVAGLVWAGAVVWLLVLAWCRPGLAPALARRFSPVGIGLVLLLGLGAWGQWLLIGGLPGLLGTGYGRLVLMKSGLLLVMLACAALNGLWFAPDGRLRALRISLGLEAVAGGVIVLLAALLAVQVLGLHGEVVWPFASRPAPGLWQDAFLRDRLLRMAWPAGLALAALLLAVLSLRWSRIAAGAGALVALFLLWGMPLFPAAPFLRPALPTSFQLAEVRRNAVTVPAGATLFARDCAGCHGTDAKGRGPQASGDPVWPPDLTSAYFLNTNDGDWFWRIRHGTSTRDGRVAMPAQPGLEDAGIWQIIDWLRANASARSMDEAGVWGIPPVAPVWRLRCAGVRLDLSRPPEGQPLYFGPGTAPTGATGLDPAECSGGDPAVMALVAQLAGRNPSDIAGLLIDGDGHLRQIWTAPPDTAAIARAAAEARARPAATARGHH